MAKILVVEDDEDVALSISDALAVEHHTVECVHDGKEGLDRLKFYKYDLAILDWNLPNLSGVDICSQFRERGGNIPILMLTGKNQTVDKISGLNSGADDYLTKPFDVHELGARVRALLRRPAAVTGNTLAAGDFQLDTQTFRVTRKGEEIKLLPKEFAVLEFLIRHKNQVFGVDSLLDRVWHSESDASPDAVRQCIARLRKKIDVDGEPSLITTVVGVGYKVDAPES